MAGRTMSNDELFRFRQKQQREEAQFMLNLLWRTACVAARAAIDQIDTSKDLSEDEKDQAIHYERELLRAAKRPEPMEVPEDHTDLIAFRRELEDTQKRYRIMEDRNGYFYLS